LQRPPFQRGERLTSTHPSSCGKSKAAGEGSCEKEHAITNTTMVASASEALHYRAVDVALSDIGLELSSTGGVDKSSRR
ncbi:MAG: hypothetical protein ACR2JB_11770, partial [Bryobacteraceae bacterium]